MILEDLYHEIAIDCPGAPEPLINNALVTALREFCNRTRFWRRDLVPVDLVAGQAEYTLTAPDDSEIVTLALVQFTPSPDLPLVPRSTIELDRDFPGWRNSQASQPAFYYQPTANTIRPVYTPSENVAGGLAVTAALRPTMAATEMDEGVYQEYGSEIVAGAKARLQMSPGKPWSAPDFATLNAGLFAGAVGRARIRVFKSNTLGPTTAVAPEFGF